LSKKNDNIKEIIVAARRSMTAASAGVRVGSMRLSNGGGGLFYKDDGLDTFIAAFETANYGGSQYYVTLYDVVFQRDKYVKAVD
jgi:hypothetical protein